MRRLKRWSIKEKQLHLFQSKELCVALGFESVLGFAEKKASLEFQPLSLWNKTTWRG